MNDPPVDRRPTPFVIVGLWRSGTKFVWQRLDAHRDVAVARLEVVPWPTFTSGVGVFTDMQGDWDMRRSFVRDGLELLARTGNDGAYAAYGVKAALRDADEALDVVSGLQQYLEDHRVIIVQRNDLLARFASTYLATKTRVWHVASDATPHGLPSEHLDPDAFRRFAVECRETRAVLGLLEKSHRVTVVDYERDILGGKGLTHVFELLGLDDDGGQSALGKTTSPYEQWVANLDELREIEATTPTPDEVWAERRLVEHMAKLHVDENRYLLLGHARFLQRSQRFLPAHLAAERALLAFTGQPITLEARSLCLLKWAFRRHQDQTVMERSLHALRERHGATAEFGELEIELALSRGDHQQAKTLLQRARARGADCDTLHRLDDLERQIEAR